MPKATVTEDAAYLTSPNIVHPRSNLGATGEPYVLAAEDRARAIIAETTAGITVLSGNIKRGR